MRPTTVSAAGKLVNTHKLFHRRKKANQKLSLETQHNKIEKYFLVGPRGRDNGAKGLANSKTLNNFNSCMTNPKGQDEKDKDQGPGDNLRRE